jgi:hypothetical protein
VVFQRYSLLSSAINSRTVRRGWRLRTAAIMSIRVRPPSRLAARACGLVFALLPPL